ncbi:TIGR00296 family protein [Candidatus Woesearchaeota archaeon]|nr:TIGR00296 family protein [Candidatus Woesearchaeota archaeon]
MIPLADGEKLVLLARRSIASRFSDSPFRHDRALRAKYGAKQGVFVTLTIDGELRGCIGFPEPVYPLYDAVIDAAQAAAFEDPRFPPHSEEEFKEAAVEVSVLTVPEEIRVKDPSQYPMKVRIGTDGLIVRSAEGSGLLLPQVFPEWKADSEKALSLTCRKAGLPSEAWRSGKVTILRFQAQIFSEEDGRVVERKH